MPSALVMERAACHRRPDTSGTDDGKSNGALLRCKEKAGHRIDAAARGADRER
jgi:hypothetical protein